MRLLMILTSVCFMVSCADNALDRGLLSTPELVERGQELFFLENSCVDCHGEDAGGSFLAPSLAFGPRPTDIAYQLETNPDMAEIAAFLKASEQDLLALSLFVLQLTGIPLDSIDVAALWQETLLTAQPDAETQVSELEGTAGQGAIPQSIESFSTILESWRMHAVPGSLKQTYDVKLLAEFDPGEPKFTPEPGKTYFYENTGTRGTMNPETGETFAPQAMKIVVGDAVTREVIAYHELPVDLRSSVHTTAMSPDGRYIYIIGAKEAEGTGPQSPLSSATWLKADAVTLQPIKQLQIGGRVHHAQIFQDRYLLIDTFATDPDGLSVFLFDTQTDEIISGIRTGDLGGRNYTAWTDDKHIYLLMEPFSYGYFAAQRFMRGELRTMPSSWIAKLDPETWEVLQEYPHPGYRADWICFDKESEYMYVPSTGSNNLSKINMDTGNIEWVRPTGTGPYACNLNAEQTEVWVADKGEATLMVGSRTVTVYDAKSGRHLDTLFSAYRVDHLLLSPNGNEFWLTSNVEGAIYVFDARSRERKDIIHMPNGGDAHGLVWVHYDQTGTPKVIRDQGGFHNGVDPRDNRPHIH
ncbi:MAG: hypothetical protein AAEI08_00920 [Gammaproteobacteria bacterium]